MKKIIFFSAITMAMIFLFPSCKKDCLNCGGGYYTQQQQVNYPPVKMTATETVVKGGAFVKGWVFCYYLSYGPWLDLRDKDGNDLHVISCEDQAILNKNDWNNWNYNEGPAGNGGPGDALVMMYPDGTLARVDGYPKPVWGSFKITHFYGKTLGKKEDGLSFDLGDLKYQDGKP